MAPAAAAAAAGGGAAGGGGCGPVVVPFLGISTVTGAMTSWRVSSSVQGQSTQLQYGKVDNHGGDHAKKKKRESSEAGQEEAGGGGGRRWE